MKEVKKQLEQIVDRDNLNESNNYGIALEKILIILDCWGERMKSGKHGQRTKRNNFIPIECKEILKLIKLDYARYYYRKQIEEKIKIRTSATSWYIPWNSKHFEVIEESAHKALQENIEFSRPNNYVGGVPWEVLESALQIVQRKYSSINKPLLPGPDLAQFPSFYINESEYSDEQLQKYLQTFYEVFLEEYKVIVETNFPTLKDRFYFYSILPVRLVVEIYLTKQGSRWIKYAFIPHQPKNFVEVHINTHGDNPRIRWDFNSKKDIIFTDRGKVELDWTSGKKARSGSSSLYKSFSSWIRKVPISPHPLHQDKGASSHTVIRNAVYDEVKKELKKIINSIT